jgi:peroxiredoxin
VGIDRDEPMEKLNEFAAQTNITYPLGLDAGSEIFMKYAEKEAGVTRNVIINRQGKIIYMTRLFNREEFDAMKKVIFDELKKN